jgi:hypothetical protein
MARFRCDGGERRYDHLSRAPRAQTIDRAIRGRRHMRRPCPKACRDTTLKKEDLKEMAGRCRLIARTADKFTRIRLLELASKYEAQIESRSAPAKHPYADRQPRGERKSD